jgi:agmatine deiminase
MTITLNAEWSAQSGVILAWPHPQSDWRDNLDAAEQVYCELTRHITRFEKLLIIHRDTAHLDSIRKRLGRQSIDTRAIIWCQAPGNDSWARDFGPITVFDDGRPLLLDFTFNGWGNKYPSELDNRITRRLHDQGCLNDTPLRSLDFILEGGAIDCDGDGSLLTTTRCLLAPTRNPALDRAAIEAVVSETLGIDRVLWLEHGELSGDDTDSHVDMLARFCSHDTIAFSHCDDPEDIHFQPLQAMQRELERLRRKDGGPYRLVPLTLPQARFNDAGQRLPASYANFLIINGAVLVPIYDDPADNVALQRLKACFPQREIIAINCLALIQQYGSLHCVSMQLPGGVL